MEPPLLNDVALIFVNAYIFCANKNIPYMHNDTYMITPMIAQMDNTISYPKITPMMPVKAIAMRNKYMKIIHHFWDLVISNIDSLNVTYNLNNNIHNAKCGTAAYDTIIRILINKR